MSDLETTIRSLAKNGRLNHFSLLFNNNGTWSASYRGVDHNDKRIAEHADPVSALTAALSGRKPSEAPAAKPVRKPRRPTPQDDNDFEDLL